MDVEAIAQWKFTSFAGDLLVLTLEDFSQLSQASIKLATPFVTKRFPL